MKIIHVLLAFALMLCIARAKVIERDDFWYVEQLENETCEPTKTWTTKDCTRKMCNTLGTHITTELCRPANCEPSKILAPQPSQPWPRCCTRCDY